MKIRVNIYIVNRLANYNNEYKSNFAYVSTIVLIYFFFIQMHSP